MDKPSTSPSYLPFKAVSVPLSPVKLLFNQAAISGLGSQTQEQLHGLSTALDTQRVATKAFAAHCDKAHEQCEELRRAAVVRAAQVDAVNALMREQLAGAASRCVYIRV